MRKSLKSSSNIAGWLHIVKYEVTGANVLKFSDEILFRLSSSVCYL